MQGLNLLEALDNEVRRVTKHECHKCKRRYGHPTSKADSIGEAEESNAHEEVHLAASEADGVDGKESVEEEGGRKEVYHIEDTVEDGGPLGASLPGGWLRGIVFVTHHAAAVIKSVKFDGL